ncbi:uncharacterized protein B0J16DRAFT_406235 [Fusarium flagelliforme]|uniref:uncharacterized protein n=1 Tax=Fusarium flagelliforme TaxID=2675880 RepID=UPI001E8D2412|nr:uncharacterized protein B0J16DRAFT_406235 [Fusarium flagelliforme]KAH7173876.1 hypothetical protein B0J16DRAFT_406235 [Fusarium flagelliforme]
MDSAPLLQNADGLPSPNVMQDHPAFLRACHSPWSRIPQNVLVIIRGLLLTFLIAVGILILNFELHETSEFTNWRIIFDFANISFFFIVLYQLQTFSWTFTHLYYPHHHDRHMGGVEGLLIRTMSLPKHMGNLRKQFHFTLFYTLCVVFAFANSTIYFFITRQQSKESRAGEPQPELRRGNSTVIPTWAGYTEDKPQPPFTDIFGEGWFRAFIILSLYAFGTLVMVIEIFVLNSIRRPYTVGLHLIGILFFATAYLGWAAFGRLVTDYSPFFWLDKKEVGSDEAITLYSIGFVFLIPIMYILMQGFVACRETFTRSKNEARAIAAAQAALDQ